MIASRLPTLVLSFRTSFMNPPTAITLPARRSLTGWAVLALGLVAGFYVLSLLLAAGCAYLPYVLLTQANFNLGQGILLLVCGLFMSGTMLWSLVPRRDKFPAPGPRLEPSRHPHLFAELESIASALNEPMPQEVYLIPDVNAWVAERGGLMGFGSRRVMGLGLPVLQILSVSEFRSVVAHEFGHYYSGDTRLGPWVYRTRDAMIRTLVTLRRGNVVARGVAGLLYHFVVRLLTAYWKLFLRTSQMISRRQEFRADELACHVAGSKPFIHGLRSIHGTSAALPVYWEEVAQVINAGYRPPIADGFARFIAAAPIAEALTARLEKELGEAKTDPFNSHPPLRHRILAPRRLPTGERAGSEPQAISLLDDVPGLEVRLLEVLYPKLKAASLKPARWETVGTEVYAPAWKSFVEEYASLLAGVTAGSLGEVAKNLREMGSRIRDPQGVLLTHEQRAQRAANLLWMAFALALIDRGWKLNSEPGSFDFEYGGEHLNPIQIIQELASGKLTREVWLERCRVTGIEEVPFDRIGPSTATQSVQP